VKETALSRCFRAVALCLLHIFFASDYSAASHLGERYAQAQKPADYIRRQECDG